MRSNPPIQRRIPRTATTPPPAPGFAGPGHSAAFIVDSDEFVRRHPFILLLDDRLELPGRARETG
ncbi:MAG TPA: hypothetical protein VF188_06895 [Longimicrobiales bacterium]